MQIRTLSMKNATPFAPQNQFQTQLLIDNNKKIDKTTPSYQRNLL